MSEATQPAPTVPQVQVTDRRESTVTVPNVERVVRDAPAERQVVREMSRSERVAAAASTFTSSRETAKAAKEGKPAAEAENGKGKESGSAGSADAGSGADGVRGVREQGASAKSAAGQAAAGAASAGDSKTEPGTDGQAAPAPEKPAEPKPDDKVAKRYADLADRERRINARDEKSKADLAKERAEIADAKRALDEFNALKAKAAQDPQAFLKATGLTFEQLARAFIEDKKKPASAATPTPALSEEEIEKRVLAKLEERMAAQRAENEEKTRTAQREQVRTQVAEQVRASDKYPALKLLNAEAEVFDYAMAVYEKGDARRGLKPGTRLDLDKAAEIMEPIARQEAERKYGPERVQAFIEAGKKPAMTPPEVKPSGNGSPAQANAAVAGAKTAVEKRERKDRASDGRFTSRSPNRGAASASEDDSDLTWEEQRALERQRATELFQARMRK